MISADPVSKRSPSPARHCKNKISCRPPYFQRSVLDWGHANGARREGHAKHVHVFAVFQQH